MLGVARARNLIMAWCTHVLSLLLQAVGSLAGLIVRVVRTCDRDRVLAPAFLDEPPVCLMERLRAPSHVFQPTRSDRGLVLREKEALSREIASGTSMYVYMTTFKQTFVFHPLSYWGEGVRSYSVLQQEMTDCRDTRGKAVTRTIRA